jgi:hypothetical protein
MTQLYPVPLKPLRILIVDDDDLFARSLSAILADMYLRKDRGFDALEEAVAAEQWRASGATTAAVSAR